MIHRILVPALLAGLIAGAFMGHVGTLAMQADTAAAEQIHLERDAALLTSCAVAYVAAEGWRDLALRAVQARYGPGWEQLTPESLPREEAPDAVADRKSRSGAEL